MDYKKMIIEILEESEDDSFLEYLYGLIKALTKKWG